MHELDLSNATHCSGPASAVLYTRDARWVLHERQLYRVKNPQYSNYVAAEEAFIGRYFSLSGLSAPRLQVAVGCDGLFAFDARSRGDFAPARDPAGYACVASQAVEGFKDLGTFLLDGEVMDAVLDPADHPRYRQVRGQHQQADEQLAAIEQTWPGKSHRHDPAALAQVRDCNARRFAALEAMNELLPASLRDEQIKHYVMSRQINNWDYLNFAFCNFGYMPARGGFRGVSVDFGGSGTLGFGGLGKAESYERAIRGARPENPLACSSTFKREDSVFDGKGPVSLSDIGAIPRSRPLLTVVRGLVQAETEAGVDGLRTLPHTAANAVAEVAYRLQCIPPQAIRQFCRQNWQPGRDAAYPFRDKDPQHNLDATGMADILAARRGNLIERIGEDQVQRWAQRHPGQALAASREVRQALRSEGLPLSEARSARSASLSMGR